MTCEARIKIVGKDIIRYPPGATYGPRINDNYEFIWIVRGNCRIEIDGRSYDSPPNSVFLLQPRQRIFFEWDKTQTTVQGYIQFTLQTPIPGLEEESAWPRQAVPDSDNDILLPLLNYLAGIRDEGDPALALLLEAGMLQAVITFVKHWTRFGTVALPERNPTLSDLFRAINDLLEGSNSRSITLKKLASRTSVTPEYLCRLTRKEMNTTPVELVYRLKIEKAASLLSRTDLPVKNIAELCGFENVYHFSRRFKSQTGVPPAHFRTLANLGIVVAGSKFERSNVISDQKKKN
jgi:AraC-like DNA-binding protein